MDSLAFRLANALVGNPDGAAGLEVTLSGADIHRGHQQATGGSAPMAVSVPLHARIFALLH